MAKQSFKCSNNITLVDLANGGHSKTHDFETRVHARRDVCS